MRRESSGAGHRHARLQGLIFEELRSLLRDDVSDPILVESRARIRAVVLSVDYRHARVHFTIPSGLGAEEPTRVERAFIRATPLLRARLADSLDIKRVPDLRFIFDGVTNPEDDLEPPSTRENPADHGEDPWTDSGPDEPPCSE